MQSLIIFLSLNYAFGFNPYTTQLTNITETPGVDSSSSTYQLLSSSDWKEGIATAFSNSCDDFNLPTGYYYNSNPLMRDSVLYITTSKQIASYISPSQNCSANASSSYDPLRLATWSDMGLIRDPSFGTSNMSCGPSNACSGVTLNSTTSNQ